MVNIKKLILLEMKKNSLKKYVLGSAIIIIFICFFMIVAMDSVTHENPPTKMTYAAIIKSINAFMMEAFIVWNAVLVAKIIVEEYVYKTVLILFTYPVRKSKLILAKMILITAFGIFCTIIGDIVGITFVSVLDSFSDVLEGEFLGEYLILSVENILLGVFTVAVFGMIPYILGIYKRNIAITIVGGFITAFIVQIFVSQCKKLVQIFSCFFIIGFFLLVITRKVSNKCIKNIEDL